MKHINQLTTHWWMNHFFLNSSVQTWAFSPAEQHLDHNRKPSCESYEFGFHWDNWIWSTHCDVAEKHWHDKWNWHTVLYSETDILVAVELMRNRYAWFQQNCGDGCKCRLLIKQKANKTRIIPRAKRDLGKHGSKHTTGYAQQTFSNSRKKSKNFSRDTNQRETHTQNKNVSLYFHKSFLPF